MNAAIKNSIAAMIPDLTEWRHDFHRHPELMYDLPRTAGIVAGRLRSFGFDEVIEGVEKELRRICEKTGEAFGTKVHIHRPPITPYRFCQGSCQ